MAAPDFDSEPILHRASTNRLTKNAHGSLGLKSVELVAKGRARILLTGGGRLMEVRPQRSGIPNHREIEPAAWDSPRFSAGGRPEAFSELLRQDL
jgi:hypothetical protein